MQPATTVERVATLTHMEGLAPRVGKILHVLVLGSFPGQRSLEQREYYAHPQNRFWPAVAAGLGISAALSYAARIAALHDAGIGLWDVLAHCERRGSLDQAIVPGSERPNPLGDVIGAHPELRAILLNGQSVARLFHRHQLPRDLWRTLDVAIRVMPSTSPAHARTPREEVIRTWARTLARLRHRP